MAVENKRVSSLRDTLIIVVVGLIGLASGTLGGYLAYSYLVISESSLINLNGSSTDSPFEQTYRGMARLGGLETAAGGCDGKAVRLEIIERESQIIDRIQSTSKKANLDPPMNVARAIVAYRSAKIADTRSDKQGSDNHIRQGIMFLQTAGWKDASPKSLETVVQQSDNCRLLSGIPKEKK